LPPPPCLPPSWSQAPPLRLPPGRPKRRRPACFPAGPKSLLPTCPSSSPPRCGATRSTTPIGGALTRYGDGAAPPRQSPACGAAFPAVGGQRCSPTTSHARMNAPICGHRPRPDPLAIARPCRVVRAVLTAECSESRLVSHGTPVFAFPQRIGGRLVSSPREDWTISGARQSWLLPIYYAVLFCAYSIAKPVRA